MHNLFLCFKRFKSGINLSRQELPVKETIWFAQCTFSSSSYCMCILRLPKVYILKNAFNFLNLQINRRFCLISHIAKVGQNGIMGPFRILFLTMQTNLEKLEYLWFSPAFQFDHCIAKFKLSFWHLVFWWFVSNVAMLRSESDNRYNFVLVIDKHSYFLLLEYFFCDWKAFLLWKYEMCP